MAEYHLIKEPPEALDLAKLQGEYIAAGLPVDYLNGGPIGSGDVYVFTSRDLDPTEQTLMFDLTEAHDGRPRQTRVLWSILDDLTRLDNTQLSAIWNDLMSGSPPKLALDTGPNAASIFVMQFVAANIAGLSTTEKNQARQRVMSFYTQDNVSYLGHPPFDPSIEVPGDEPVP